ncbi:hypothetical protein BofuT4_P081920.1 [Botrytis cinerea T4]|uniref:Uncharacterized protein n=1 Tax=Botryotinia fuckeliana (strain T4) TaxID=999810 RepID=G2YK85_BOTF4|nr:hypothetical protein BofuT4_P081920.1 [Botrytis cinerea T4]
MHTPFLTASQASSNPLVEIFFDPTKKRPENSPFSSLWPIDSDDEDDCHHNPSFTVANFFLEKIKRWCVCVQVNVRPPLTAFIDIETLTLNALSNLDAQNTLNPILAIFNSRNGSITVCILIHPVLQRLYQPVSKRY